MDDETRRAIEILTNILYPIGHDADDARLVRFYLEAGKAAIQHLQELASKPDAGCA